MCRAAIQQIGCTVFSYSFKYMKPTGLTSVACGWLRPAKARAKEARTLRETLPDFAFDKASMTSRDIREVGCFALFSTSEVVENRTNGPLKPVLLRGSSTTSFMWSFGWLTRLGSSFLKIFWPDISKNSKKIPVPTLKRPAARSFLRVRQPPLHS